jgi:hypothetical protein
MTIDDVRRQMEGWWRDTDSAAIAAKDSQRVTLDLVALIRGLDPEERAMADVVIGEWLLSTEERKRFDALAVVGEVEMQVAIPTLRVLESQLVTKQDPGAPFELKKVRRLLAQLEP